MDVARIYTGSDHAGFNLRRKIVDRLRGQGRDVVDLGPDTDNACDYPELASAVANAVRCDPRSCGILVCATGQGMAIAAGKVRGIRAVNPTTVEAARLSRFDNDANVLCLAGRVLSDDEANAIVDVWLATGFAGGRHARRIAKIAAMETAAAVSFVTESERLLLAELGIPSAIVNGGDGFASGHPAFAAVRTSRGFVALPAEMPAHLTDVASFVEGIRRDGIKDIILVVEDASTSTAAMMAKIAAQSTSSGSRLHIDSAIDRPNRAAPEDNLSLQNTLVLLSARSANPAVLYDRERALRDKFLARLGGDETRTGAHFAAIAATGSDSAERARAGRYRAVFVDPPDLPDEFAALAHEGVVPAALFGMDGVRLMARAKAMAEGCRRERLEDNPGASLGVLLGAMAKLGRHNLDLSISESLAAMGPWIARLLSKVTRAFGRGIVVSLGQPALASPPNRVVLQLQVGEDPPAIAADKVEALCMAGQPCIQIAIRDRFELGAEIVRWQIAAVVATVVLGSHLAPQAAEPIG